MGRVRTGKAPLLEWAAASIAYPGETRSGDAYLVHAHERGLLVAAVDGVGHGGDANTAASRAVEVMTRCGAQSIISIVRTVHDALSGTRGAVMSLAMLDASDATLSWIGIGNVQGVLLRADARALPRSEGILSRGGVVGVLLPQLRATVAAISPGDTLIFATDGVRPDFADRLDINKTPEEIVRHIRSQYFKADDDALILVGRYLGQTETNS